MPSHPIAPKRPRNVAFQLPRPAGPSALVHLAPNPQKPLRRASALLFQSWLQIDLSPRRNDTLEEPQIMLVQDQPCSTDDSLLCIPWTPPVPKKEIDHQTCRPHPIWGMLSDQVPARNVSPGKNASERKTSTRTNNLARKKNAQRKTGRNRGMTP